MSGFSNICQSTLNIRKFLLTSQGSRFVELETSDKDFVKTPENGSPQGNILEFFLLHTLKNTF